METETVTLHGGPTAPAQRTALRVRLPGDVLDVKVCAYLGHEDAPWRGPITADSKIPPTTEHIVRYRLSRMDGDGHRHYVFTGEIDP